MRVGVVVAILLAATAARAATPNTDLQSARPADFGGKWSDGNWVGLGRALVAHNVKDCGYYSWKKGTDGKSVVVYCTNYPERHDRWSRYMVSVDSSRVIGPLKPWAGYRAPQP